MWFNPTLTFPLPGKAGWWNTERGCPMPIISAPHSVYNPSARPSPSCKYPSILQDTQCWERM